MYKLNPSPRTPFHHLEFWIFYGSTPKYILCSSGVHGVYAVHSELLTIRRLIGVPRSDQYTQNICQVYCVLYIHIFSVHPCLHLSEVRTQRCCPNKPCATCKLKTENILLKHCYDAIVNRGRKSMPLFSNIHRMWASIVKNEAPSHRTRRLKNIYIML